MSPRTTASYSATVRIEYPNAVGMLGAVTSAIGAAGGDIGSIDIVRTAGNRITRDISFSASGADHLHRVVDQVRAMPGVVVRHVTDRTFAIHHGGKIEIALKHPVNSRDDLSMVYTPGVARVCTDIAKHPKHAYAYTIKANSVAVVTDGTAVLGLGDIGPLAALPVMEGKAMLFKQFAGVDAWPVCLDTKDPDEIVETVKRLAPSFGGINLEDISAPRCFDIEERLRQELSIPVFHDDQHGTAVVVLAALYNALKIVRKEMAKVRIVMSGAGAAGLACVRLLIRAGVTPGNIVICDSKGALYRGRKDGMNRYKDELAAVTNRKRQTGDVHACLKGADVFMGTSGPGLLTPADIRTMAGDAVVFAMANPVPEIMPEDAAEGGARIVASGRSDYPNQINNVLCFPGFFRGLLDSHAVQVTYDMKLAAAQAIASLVKPSELNEDYIIPAVFDKRTPHAVAKAVGSAARKRDRVVP